MSEELKPCECGKMPAVFAVTTLEFREWAVICICGKQTPLFFDKEAAISAWNKRS